MASPRDNFVFSLSFLSLIFPKNTEKPLLRTSSGFGDMEQSFERALVSVQFFRVVGKATKSRLLLQPPFRPFRYHSMSIQMSLAIGTRLDYMCETNTRKGLWVFSGEGVWGMGYHGIMGYGAQIPAYRYRRIALLWGIRGYGLFTLWVKRGLSVLQVTIRGQ